MKAVIVGGGIGGLACALALARRGWQTEVLERAAMRLLPGASFTRSLAPVLNWSPGPARPAPPGSSVAASMKRR